MRGAHIARAILGGAQGTPTPIVMLAAAVVLLGTTVPVTAGHLAPVTARCTYEVGEIEQIGTGVDFATEDPLGATADGAVNKTVCPFHTPDSDPGEGFPLPHDVIVGGVITVDGQYGRAQASIVDDAFGNAIGGNVCADLNHDHNCSAEQGEPVHAFCGTSPIVEVEQDSDGDGHSDFGWGLVVLVNGYYHQALNCDVVDAPTSTTGGVLDPAGGVYVTLSG